MSKKDIFEEEFTESYKSISQPPPDIVVFNELRSCADLYRMHEKSQIEIQPFFQRDGVWTAADQTRFVDSLIKQLPIPSMCFALDYTTRKWIVIDGLQRISAIIKFLSPLERWNLSKLEDIDPQLSGASSDELHDNNSKLHELVERVENLSLPITVLRCNFSDETHMEYLFKIFHRLNTGGVRLNNQEIRNCIYSGTLNKMLMTIDKSTSWRKLHTHLNGKKDRFRSVELILRILAFTTDLDSYEGNLATFLNDFMFKHRWDDEEHLSDFENKFNLCCKLLDQKIFPHLEMKKLGFTQFEALAVGVLMNLGRLEDIDLEGLKKSIKQFEGIDLLKGKALSEGVSRVDKVKGRLKASINAFA